MFGYVVINEQELKVREVGLYRSYYCGFCKRLREKYGLPGQMTLSYDMTFLILLLTDLYDAEDEEEGPDALPIRWKAMRSDAMRSPITRPI